MASNAYALANAFGYLRQEEVYLLQYVAGLVREDAVIINIGAGAGTSALAMREIRPDATMYTVDISPGGPLGGMEGERNAFANAGISHLLPIQIIADSKTVGKYWDRGEVSLVFVDGDHSVEGARGDIREWRKHIENGGYMAIHDYHKDTWKDVYDVVNEEFEGVEPIGTAYSLVVFQIKKE
jgi:predicted O-methyltransferase YrrM